MKRNPVRTTMVALLYPAVHGAALVWLVSKWVETGSLSVVATDARSYLALWLVLFFGVSYVIIDATPPDNYNAIAFLLDLVEIVLVFACFVALGYVSPRVPDYTWVFGLLAGVPLLQSLWNLAVGRKRLWRLSIVATIVCTIVAVAVKHYIWFVWIGIFILYSLLVYYLSKRSYEAAAA